MILRLTNQPNVQSAILPNFQSMEIVCTVTSVDIRIINVRYCCACDYLTIENSNDDLVWSEQVNVKSDGQFTTLTFAGGSGWEKSGTFTIKAESDSEQITNTFSFSR